MSFKKGDMVRCINSNDERVFNGEVYEVFNINTTYSCRLIEIQVNGTILGFYEHRFELAPKTKLEKYLEII